MGLLVIYLDKNIIKSRSILFNERMKRIPPLLDDKILTDWNSLMISSLARASAIFENQEWIKYAENAYEFILNNLIINGFFIIAGGKERLGELLC